MTKQFIAVAIFVAAFALSAQVDARRLRIAPRPFVRADPPQKCDRCTDAVTKVSNELTNPNTTAQVKQVLELICQFKPDDQARVQCRTQLDSEIDQVVANITATLAQPLAFCQKYNLCEYQICDQCIEGVTNVYQQVFGPGGIEANIRGVAENYFCANLPSFLKDTCDRFVDASVNSVFDPLQKKLNNSQEVCIDLKVCNATQITTLARVAETETAMESAFLNEFLVANMPRTDVPCAICEGLGLAVFIELEAGKTQPEIEARLDAICQKLPIEDLKDACKKFVDENLEKFIPAVKAANGNVLQACQTINLCRNTEQEKAEQRAAVEALFVSQIVAAEVPSSDIPCAMCEGMGLAIFIALEEGKTQAEIESRLDAVCQKLPIPELATACKKFLDENLEKFIPAVKASNGNIPQACKQINLCNNQAAEQEQNLLEEDVVQASVSEILNNVQDGYPCAMCEGVGLAIYIALLEGKTEDQIIQRMEIICSRLPGKLQTICDKFVEVDLKIFIPAIKASNGNVRGACHMIGLCI